MDWSDWVLLIIFVPPLVDMTGFYWGSVFRKYGGLVKRLRRKRRPTVFWPE